MAKGSERLQETQAARGAVLYAENCVICHGPIGEGVVGPPLARAEWKEGTPLEMEATADFLTRTIARGRGGRADTTWIHNPDGTIESHTAMPVFGKENGGPFNEQQVEDLVVFLTSGSFSAVGRALPVGVLSKAVPKPDPDNPGETIMVNVALEPSDLPLAVGVSDAVNDRGRELMLTRTCITCHVIGDYGRPYGPNLADTGNWTTPEFLREWLTDTENVVNRTPTIWWGNNERKEIITDSMGAHRTLMPNPLKSMGATPEDIEIIIEYLSGLRP